MTERSYRLIRFIPDPIRGESINVALVGFSAETARVLAPTEQQLAQKLACVAPHVSPAVLEDFLAELRSAENQLARLRKVLGAFDTHFVASDELYLASTRSFESQLEELYTSLVGPPRPRPVARERDLYAGVTGAIRRAASHLSSFRELMLTGIRVERRPELFGIREDMFGERAALKDVGAFDVVLPNCTRVVAFRGFVTSTKANLGSFIERKMQIERARSFFESAGTEKTVFTGALLVPGKDNLPLGQRDEIKNDLIGSVSVMDPYLTDSPLPAVFDLENPADRRLVETLSARLASVGSHEE